MQLVQLLCTYRSAAEYIREVRDYVAEHGRPPRCSPSLSGTAEYQLRTNVQKKVKKGRFSEEERKILTQLIASKAPAGGTFMPTNERRAVAASGELPVDSASQQASSAAAASGLQAGVGADFAAPATPPGCATSTLLGSVGATASTGARRYRGKRPPPSPAAGATPHGSAAKCRWRGKILPDRFRAEELYFEAQEGGLVRHVRFKQLQVWPVDQQGAMPRGCQLGRAPVGCRRCLV